MRVSRCHFRLLGRAVALALVLAASGFDAEAAPKVVVTVKPVHALVAAIMAGAGSPQLLVEGSASPHTFTLKPSAARAIEQADIFIRVSEATEPFTHRLAEGLPKAVTLITLADEKYGVTLLDQRAGGAFEAHHHDGEAGHEDHGDDDAAGHSGDGHAKNGHIWLDPENAKAITDAVASALAARAPDDAAVFKANAQSLKARIDALATDIAAELAPVKGKPFIAFHDAYQYFEKRFGLTAAGTITLSPEQQTSARRLSEVRAKIKDTGAACVFAEPGFQPNLVAAVSEGTRARIATLDPEGLLLMPGPDLYFVLMKNLSQGFKACLAAPQ